MTIRKASSNHVFQLIGASFDVETGVTAVKLKSLDYEYIPDFTRDFSIRERWCVYI